MFRLTLGRTGAKRLGAALLCAAVLSGALFAASRITQNRSEAEAVSAEAGVTIKTTQDLASYFQGYGLEVDLTIAAIDEVKIPKKWDADFEAFHAAIQESGGDLTKYKGKTVEKWTILCPGRSSGADQVYGVLLVYKKAPIGAYLLTQPSGQVTGLTSAAQTAAPLTEEETAASADFGQAAETGASPEETAETGAEVVPDDTAETGAEISLEDAGAMPVE